MHEQFLLLALEQAKLGQGGCYPNPCVGAVAVQNGQIIAQAWHKAAGTPHAEQLLLAQFAPKTPEVTVYITLEPCNHWGKTPPCVEALTRHGIKRVVFAYLDPNPVVSKNNSSDLLRQAGIDVIHLPHPEIDALYQSYTYWQRHKKPWVTVKMAQSLDGKIAGAGGRTIPLSNALCKEFTHQQRAKTDIILTTARTIAADNPQLNVRLAGKEYGKPLAILDSSLGLDANSQVFSTASNCLIYHRENQKASYPNSQYYPMPVREGNLDLEAVISHLGSLGFHDVWVEAGGTLFTALHKQGLVQRTWLYLAPKVLGPEAVSAYQAGNLFDKPHKISWHPMGDNLAVCIDWLEG